MVCNKNNLQPRNICNNSHRNNGCKKRKIFGYFCIIIFCIFIVHLLEKIGFTQVSKHLGDGIDYRFSNDNECRIWHTLLNNSSYEYNIHTNESSKNIKYLHQLQHELFDAGIELKIEL